MELLTLKAYLDANAKLNANTIASDTWRKENKTNGIPQEVYSKFPFADEVTNELRSAIEIYEFVANPPKKYFLYPKNGSNEVTTWMGQKLGTYTVTGVYKGNWGDSRKTIHVKAINGKEYFGTIYGTYARIKMCKASETN